MILRKWNYDVHRYGLMMLPNEWNCKCYSEDMNEIVNCPHCGKELPYGETYASFEIHTSMGLGYGVCEKCYKKEIERRTQNEKTSSI